MARGEIVKPLKRPLDEPGMWQVVQAAVTDGWAATARLCLFVFVRYGPRCGLAVVALRALLMVMRHRF